MTPKETLHSILLDAKARIKNGELYHDRQKKCFGLCDFVWHSHKFNSDIDALFDELLDDYVEVMGNFFYVATIFDFNDPKRIALLDWLIERTKS